MFYARRNQKYSNNPAVSRGMTTILRKRCIFQNGIISRLPLLSLQSKSRNSIKFLTHSVFCNKVGCGKKVSRHPLKTCRSHFNAEIGPSGLSSEVTTSGSHDGGGRRGENRSLKPIKRPEFYLFCFKGRRQRGPQGLLQDGSEA